MKAFNGPSLLFYCPHQSSMSRASYKLPSVFVGCPYDEKKFKFTQYRNALNRLPFNWYFADTTLSTKHLLGLLRSYIKAVDFCIFDVSMWNPNVALELGLAEGIGADYYIAVCRKLSTGVPSDIQGLQRIDYRHAGGFEKDDLLPQLCRYLVREYTHPRNIFDSLSATGRDKKFMFAMAVISHFRENNRLTYTDIQKAAQGTYLRRDTQDDVLEILEREGYISGDRGSGRKLMKNLFPEPLAIRRR
jgi:hypothetical protein